MLKKFCTKCKVKYPATLTYFHHHSTATDGLQCACKTCRNAEHKIYAQTKRGRENARKRVAKFRQSKHGKISCRITRLKYDQTEKGRLSSKKQKKKYYATITGHLRVIFNVMKQRCYNKNCNVFKWYGGRGIKICFKSSDDFVNYVVNELRVDPRGLDIDRIDNDGNYERGNIRFITHQENCQNRG